MPLHFVINKYKDILDVVATTERLSINLLKTIKWRTVLLLHFTSAMPTKCGDL